MNIKQIWPEWETEKVIGKGSFGKVYKCYRNTENGKEYSAIKVIDIPNEDYEELDLSVRRMTNVQKQEYYKGKADRCINEIKILESLKGTKNIVNVFDSKVVEKSGNGEEIGWQIFIRMELLSDLARYTSDKNLSSDDVKKLAFDICNALIVCGQKKIIHRDIKPENILVDDQGNFKLGDFGVAKQMEKSYAATGAGALNYMAPEVLNNEKYDFRADMYSLGLVMYTFLNNERLPFLDPDKQLITWEENDNAFNRRKQGEKLPPIPGVDEKLMNVVLKACEPKAEDRFSNIEEMKEALESGTTNKKSVVKFVKKHKLASIISVVLVLAIISGSVVYLFKDKTNKAEKASSVTTVDSKATDVDKLLYPVKHFDADITGYVASLYGKGIYSENDKIYLQDEINNTKKVIYEGEGSEFIFNGTDVCFLEGQFMEKTIVHKLNIETEEDTILFEMQLEDESIDLIYFDNNYLYYLYSDFDYNQPDETILYRYSFEDGSLKKELVFDTQEYDCSFFMETDNENYFCYNTLEGTRIHKLGYDIVETSIYYDDLVADNGIILCSDSENFFYSLSNKGYASVYMFKPSEYDEEMINKTSAPTGYIGSRGDKNLVYSEEGYTLELFDLYTNQKFKVINYDATIGDIYPVDGKHFILYNEEESEIALISPDYSGVIDFNYSNKELIVENCSYLRATEYGVYYRDNAGIRFNKFG